MFRRRASEQAGAGLNQPKIIDMRKSHAANELENHVGDLVLFESLCEAPRRRVVAHTDFDRVGEMATRGDWSKKWRHGASPMPPRPCRRLGFFEHQTRANFRLRFRRSRLLPTESASGRRASGECDSARFRRLR